MTAGKLTDLLSSVFTMMHRSSAADAVPIRHFSPICEQDPEELELLHSRRKLAPKSSHTASAEKCVRSRRHQEEQPLDGLNTDFRIQKDLNAGL